MVLTQVLKDFDLVPCKTDSQIYSKRTDGALVLVGSTHVGDLKGRRQPEGRKLFVAHLEKRFGALKQEPGRFEHCGVVH